MGTARACASYLSMVVVQLAFGGSSILLKISLERGLNQVVLVVYRNLIAMVVLAPFAYAFERTKHPALSFKILVMIFALAALGSTFAQNVHYLGLDYASPTVASVLGNISPCFTFLLAIMFRMEKVALRSAKGLAKIVGTTICISGAFIFTFWKGGYFYKGFIKQPLININSSAGLKHHHKHDWIKGSLLILASHVAWSTCLILQAIICKAYLARVSLNVLNCFFGALQSSVIAIIFDRNPKSWKLRWNVQLLTIVYTGIIGSALVYFLQTWCIIEKGPVFVAMFNPLALIFVGIFSAAVFAERLHIGSVIGAILIVFGLYCVLWGKSKDKGDNSSSNCDHEKSCNETKREQVKSLDCI